MNGMPKISSRAKPTRFDRGQWRSINSLQAQVSGASISKYTLNCGNGDTPNVKKRLERCLNHLTNSSEAYLMQNSCSKHCRTAETWLPDSPYCPVAMTLATVMTFMPLPRAVRSLRWRGRHHPW